MPSRPPFVLLSLIASATLAASATPEPPSPADLPRLAAGDTVVRLAAAPAVEGWAARELDVPAARVARAVGDWRHYAAFFPFVARSAAAVEGGEVVTRQTLDPPGLVPRREVVAVAAAEPPPSAAGGPRTWRFRWRGRGAGREGERGEWTITELAPARTRVEIRLAGRLGLPATLERRALARTLPWVLDGLAQQVNRCRYDRPVHPTCREAPAFAAP
ncbi:MAG TPA: hypothetical protein VF100_07970 [Thermoanaerobaculia bacterium]